MYWFYRILFYLQDPYIKGKGWRKRLYVIRNYFRYVLPLDIQIARLLTVRLVRSI